MKTQQKKKPLEDPQYRIPQWALDAAIEGLDELALRLEVEAAAFAQHNVHDSVLLADDRLQAAELYRAAAMFFATL